jgi:hypothetical protein
MDRQSLEEAISQIELLMPNDSTTEDDCQRWFEANPVVFEVLGYQKVLAHPKLTEGGIEKYIPDFLAQRIDGLWEILEIKRPDTQVLKDTERRASFYWAMETYLSQCREYSQYFDDRPNRDEFAHSYKESVQKQPSSVLIAGRSHGLNRQRIHDLLSGRVPSILHQTYDDVRNQLDFQRTKLYEAYENLQGLSIHLILMIEQPRNPIETFIFDIGAEPDRNRLSLHTHRNGTLFFSVHDSSGVLHQASVPQSDETFRYNRTFYLSLEVGIGVSYSVMVVETNGRYCSENRLSGFSLQLETPMPLVIGSDLTGQAEASMRVAEKCVYSRTLPFHEKSLLRNYMFERYGKYLFNSDKRPKGIEFHGRQFLYSEGHPRFLDPKNPRKRTTNMIQENNAFKPTFREAS